MFDYVTSFSGFSVDDLEKAKTFYNDVLGLSMEELPGMGVNLNLNGTKVFVYPKGEGHTPATYTVLNFVVKNIDESVDLLVSKGVKFEQYDMGEMGKTDEKGIMRSQNTDLSPSIAWFKDPAGNIFSVIQQK